MNKARTIAIGVCPKGNVAIVGLDGATCGCGDIARGFEQDVGIRSRRSEILIDGDIAAIH